MELLDKILKQKEKVFTSRGENVKIDSIMIEQNGQVASHFFAPDELHEMRSVSKIFVALAFGIAIDKGFLVEGKSLSLDTRIWPTIKHLAEIKTIGNLEKIEKWTLRTLLTYSAGYEKQMFSNKFIQNMSEDKFVEYVLNFPLKNQLDEKFVYNNAEIFLLCVFFQEAFGMNLANFVAQEIFAPLEIENWQWKNFGKYCAGGTGLYLFAKDLFKVSQMMLRGGVWRDRQIVSRKWIEQMCCIQIQTPYAIKPQRVLPKVAVGFVMHISRDGFAYKDGIKGQYMILNLKKKLCICILSSEEEMGQVSEILRGMI